MNSMDILSARDAGLGDSSTSHIIRDFIGLRKGWKAKTVTKL